MLMCRKTEARVERAQCECAGSQADASAFDKIPAVQKCYREVKQVVEKSITDGLQSRLEQLPSCLHYKSTLTASLY